MTPCSGQREGVGTWKPAGGCTGSTTSSLGGSPPGHSQMKPPASDTGSASTCTPGVNCVEGMAVQLPCPS